MRIPSIHLGSRQQQAAAFTLTELLISCSLMMVVLGGVIYSHLMGAKLMQIVAAKLGASDGARKAFGKLQDEVRAATTIRVGNGSATAFAVTTNGGPLQGRSIQIYPTTNQSWWIRYYYETNLSELRRVTSSNATPQVIASYVTNAVIFAKEDYLGNTLTADTGNSALNVRLQFYQLSYPQTKVGTNNYYEYFQLQSRITRRILQ